MNEYFRKIAHWASQTMGSPIAFITAILLIVLWAFAGEEYGYSNTWQLVINTSTTILTFLMVILIQNTQNRDSRAIQLKLDELIYSIKSARDTLIDVEDTPEGELDKLESEFERIHEQSIKKKE